jgi:putative copper export protein
MTLYQLSIMLHLLGSVIWVGGHLILSIRILPGALKNNDVSLIRQFEKTFEPIGLPALLIQILTGLWLAFVHYNLNFLSFGSPFEKVVTIKIALLLITLVLAVHARFFIIPKLNALNLRSMAFHILLVTVISLLLLYLGVQFRFGGI